MRSGGEHCPPKLAVEEAEDEEERRGEERRGEERRGQARRREENSEVANIKSNNPHLTGGEIHLLKRGCSTKPVRPISSHDVLA